jgi:hypothetical protein
MFAPGGGGESFEDSNRGMSFFLRDFSVLSKSRTLSNVSPRILGFLTVGMVTLLMVRFRMMFFSRVCDVKRVAVDLSGFSMRSLLCAQSKMPLR